MSVPLSDRINQVRAVLVVSSKGHQPPSQLYRASSWSEAVALQCKRSFYQKHIRPRCTIGSGCVQPPSFGTGADICTGCRRTLIFGQTCNHWCNHCKDLPPLILLAKELKELQSRQSPPDHCIGATSSVSQLAVQQLPVEVKFTSAELFSGR